MGVIFEKKQRCVSRTIIIAGHPSWISSSDVYGGASHNYSFHTEDQIVASILLPFRIRAGDVTHE